MKKIVVKIPQKTNNLMKELVVAYKTKATEDKEINKEWQRSSRDWN